MRSQCHGYRKSITVQLNLRPVRGIELYTKVRTGITFIFAKLIHKQKCHNSKRLIANKGAESLSTHKIFYGIIICIVFVALGMDLSTHKIFYGIIICIVFVALGMDPGVEALGGGKFEGGTAGIREP